MKDINPKGISMNLEQGKYQSRIPDPGQISLNVKMTLRYFLANKS